MPTESNRQVAERIVITHVHPLTSTDMRALTNDIEAALDAERERCARIAEDHDFTHSSGYRCHQGKTIAEKIRRSKQ